MKRILLTAIVGLCIILAGAIQTALHKKQRDSRPPGTVTAVSASQSQGPSEDAS